MVEPAADLGARSCSCAQPARHLQEFRRRLGADRHRSRRPCRRGRRARRRQRRRQVDAGQDPGRRAPAELGNDDVRRQAGDAREPERRAARSASRPCSRIWRSARTSTSSPTSSSAGAQPAAARRGRDGDPRLDAAQRTVGAHPERARAGRLAVGRPAPDGRDRPLAAARAEAHHARRADRGARRRPDRRGARTSSSACATAGLGVDHDQPQHGGRPRRRRPHRRAAARPQQRRLLARRLQPGAGQRHHRRADNAVSRRAQRAAERQIASCGSTRHDVGPPDARRCSTARDDRGSRTTQRRRRRRSAAFLDRVRSGDLGSLPVVVGLPSSGRCSRASTRSSCRRNNLVNLLFDCSTVGVISLGIVCILMVGEIDLSVGSVSGFASALRRRALGQRRLAGRPRDPGRRLSVGVPDRLRLRAAVQPARHAELRLDAGRACSPCSGLQLYILGSSGSINLPYGSALVNFGQSLVMPPSVVLRACRCSPGCVVLVAGLSHRAAAPSRRADAALAGGARCPAPSS